jgi:hypothetical protein
MSDLFIMSGGGSGSSSWSSLTAPTGNLTLSMGSDTTEFDQTSNVAWLWKNTTVATNVTTNASPLLELAANYNSGTAGSPVSSQDLWTLGSSLAAGPNGASTLSFTHSGSTGTAIFSIPGQITGSAGFISIQQSGTILWEFVSPTLRGGSGQVLSWSSTTSAGGTSDTGISRIAAASLAVGNGTAADASGSILAKGGFSLSSSGAGTQGMLPSGATTIVRGTTVNLSNVSGQGVSFTGGAVTSIGGQTTTGSLGVTGIVYSNVTTGIVAAFANATVFTTSAAGVYRVTGDVWPTTLSSTAWTVSLETSTTPNGATGPITTGITTRIVGTTYGGSNSGFGSTTFSLASGATIGISLVTPSGSNTSGVLSYLVNIERLA